MSENKNIHQGHRQRMWKKYNEHGMECLEDHEILEMLLFSSYPRRNTNDIAHNLINHFGSLEGVVNASREELCEIENVGPAAAASISFLNDFAKRFHGEDNSGLILPNSITIGEFCVKLLSDCKTEVSYALYLDSSFAFLGQQRLSKGTSSSVEFDLRAIVERAIKLRCQNIVLLHNHPCGTLTASQNDVATTRRVSNALQSIGINVLDHIIVAGKQYISMRSAKLLPEIWTSSI